MTGNPAPTPAQHKQWDALPAAASLDLAIDGSGSMLGLTGSAQAASAWKGLIKGVTLAAAANGLPVQAQRAGGGESKPFSDALEAADPCFFEGCGAFRPVSSSLEALWNAPGLSKGKAPLRIAISDLEVNDGDIAKLVASIRPHADQGAVIGVLAVRLPFNGMVYDSQGAVIHTGEAKRPVYLLATGPRTQLHGLLTDVKTKAALAGVATDAMQLTFLDEQANAPTLTANSVSGTPADAISGGLPVRLAGTTYSPAGEDHYQFAKLYPKAEGVTLSSSRSLPSGQEKPDLALVRLEAIALPGGSSGLNGLSVKGFQMNDQELSVTIRIPDTSPSKAVRAFVPRGQLPEAWWLSWNRWSPAEERAHDQTDGLLLMLTSLSKLMVAPGATPAASLCLAFSQ
ncbi:hypothetical protein KBZ18_10220 [Synechococcus sp. Cruz-9H2]|uniref:hypothetical protein n=1 Tax=unclassified Synechococcus TaxID=2626047 RepID=UPI0020CEF94B|nr:MULTISPECIES: hypothetical protein [unclassified Synechococcus]MCP9819868.1 hypothetical protein [Synechococcus sp. Cruz-9H2]MCP9844066.1 hypothetical protein [Synechococcus sp. Edmonson 11F2]MCP9856298.1 hypothetical protein [Synechococcus sp. Cruz-9C9]MCP9863583.1 hypothetical protein [Synechococcus sp. Cruz-7E5]MCP9870779.1 hypothetical protein [Synechococcus sp. Cruz-7B9]